MQLTYRELNSVALLAVFFHIIIRVAPRTHCSSLKIKANIKMKIMLVDFVIVYLQQNTINIG